MKLAPDKHRTTLRYQAWIVEDGKEVNLGYYSTAEEAALVRARRGQRVNHGPRKSLGPKGVQGGKRQRCAQKVLTDLPAELLVTVLAQLPPAGFVACAAVCAQLRALYVSHGAHMWRSAFGQRIRIDGPEHTSPPYSWRSLYGALGGANGLAAKGWADESELDNADEVRHAWWQADALAFDTSSTRVLVRYRGYEDMEEDKWRPLAQLRRHEEHPPAAWRAAQRLKGEAVEVAWAPPDHPSARWEASVIQSRARKAKVRFAGFDASWDTWLEHDADDMYPAQAESCLQMLLRERDGSAQSAVDAARRGHP